MTKRSTESRTVTGREVTRLQGVLRAITAKEFRTKRKIDELETLLEQLKEDRHAAERAVHKAETTYDLEAGERG